MNDEGEDDYRMERNFQNTDPLNLTQIDRARLRDHLLTFSYSYSGIESDPETYVFAEPCKVAKVKGKHDRKLKGDPCIQGKEIDGVYVAAFVYKYERFPKKGYCISHICGYPGSRCVEPTHLEVVLRSLNTGRKTCHDRIVKWEQLNQKKLSLEKRQGTIFYHDCMHWPLCYRQLGKFE